jgi:DNA-binding response OmpR family regulator
MARIILIDDDRVFARLVEARLQADGHDVYWNEGAFGVLTEVRKGGYQFILVDVQMPGIEGPALVDCLRSRGVGDSRIILMSSIAEAELRQLAIQYGVDAYFPKRHKLDNLAGIIERWCTGTSGARVMLGSNPYELRKII